MGGGGRGGWEGLGGGEIDRRVGGCSLEWKGEWILGGWIKMAWGG